MSVFYSHIFRLDIVPFGCPYFTLYVLSCVEWESGLVVQGFPLLRDVRQSGSCQVLAKRTNEMCERTGAHYFKINEAWPHIKSGVGGSLEVGPPELNFLCQLNQKT